MGKLIALVGSTLALAACQTVADPAVEDAETADSDTLAFVQGACGSCHAVEHNALSPNPMAPEWPRIANQPGLTRETLRTWLVDAHNYPEEMDFDVDGPDVDRIVDYIVTLKQDGYKPPIQ